MERTRAGAEMVWDGTVVVAGWSAAGIVYIFAQLGCLGERKCQFEVSTDLSVRLAFLASAINKTPPPNAK
jgi:hypothetical protein